MEQLIKKGSQQKAVFAAGLLTGFLLGTALITTLVSYRMDESYKKIAYLETTIQDKDARLEKLEKAINTRNLILKSIEVSLVFDGDDMDRLEIEKAIKEKYSALLGKEVESIDANLAAEVVDKRIFKLKDKEYQLHVSRLVLTEELKIWVKVEPKGM